MKIWSIGLVLILVAATLTGCGGEPEPPVEEAGDFVVVEVGDGEEAYSSEVLDASYEDAMPAGSQLALGTLMLAETENAVTAEQAETLLPLWQAIQSGSLKSAAETNAVLKQIEGAMTADQLAAIAAMRITGESMREWTQSRGIQFAPGGAPGRQGSGQGGSGPFGDLSEEERASMRATRQAMGGGGGGGFADMSEEDRAAMRATAEASGLAFPGGGTGARGGQIAFLAQPVIELLTQLLGE